VEHAAAKSILPDEPDHGWIDRFVLRTHLIEVVKFNNLEEAK